MSLRYAILGFLSIQPFTGYDIKRYFNNSVRHFWSADQAAIYRTLAELEGEQLVGHERVEQQTRPDRKLFHITPAGAAALDAWLTIPAEPVARRDPLLLKLFFLGRMAPDGLDAILSAELRSVEAELAGFRELLATIEQDRATVLEQLGPGDTAAAYRRALTGPLATLANGVRSGIAQRDWLRELTRLREQETLTDTALLVELRRALEMP
jgi:PadR family transcriptional regulator, regulatory protein AphA